MGEIDAIYEGRVLRIVNPARIDSDVVTVRILNRDEMLTEKEMRIKFFCLPPLSPKLNGGVERLNRTSREEFWACYDGECTLEALRKWFQEDYNQIRPHQGPCLSGRQVGYMTVSRIPGKNQNRKVSRMT